MKTPRDLLLERHRQQSPALDQLRQRVIAQELGTGTAAVREGRTGLQPVFERTEEAAHVRAQTAEFGHVSNAIGAGSLSLESSLVTEAHPAPSGDRLQTCPTLLVRWFALLNWQRAAWSGFAAVWCVILGLNLAAEREMGTAVAAGGPTDTEQFLAGLHANRAQLAALLADRNGDDDPATRDPKPVPRSDADRPRKDASHFKTAFV